MKHIRKHAKIALAGFMSLWLSGIVLLFCCEMPRAEAAEFCPLKKLAAHCDKALDRSSFAFNSSTHHAADCCAILPAIFKKSRKFEPVQHVAGPSAELVATRNTKIALLRVFAKPDPAPDIVLVKNHTYLRNRTFRI